MPINYKKNFKNGVLLKFFIVILLFIKPVNSISAHQVLKADSRISTELMYTPYQPDIISENEDLIEELKIWIVIILIVAAAVILFLAILIQSHRLLKKQYATIREQQDELEIRNENLRQVNKEKNSIIHYVSHDLITPLGNIEGLAQLILLERDKLSDDQKHYLEKILDVVRDGKQTVHSMLHISKIEQEIRGVSMEEVNVLQLLKEVIIGHKIFSEEKDIQLKLESPEEEIKISTDRQYFKQIFSNLVSNAIKFSDPGKNVLINIKNKDETVAIEVKDEGKGISDRDKERIFLKYEQIVSRGPSSGLGLAIVKQLVDKLNGKIRVESEQGKGSTFTVELLKKPVQTK